MSEEKSSENTANTFSFSDDLKSKFSNHDALAEIEKYLRNYGLPEFGLDFRFPELNKQTFENLSSDKPDLQEIAVILVQLRDNFRFLYSISKLKNKELVATMGSALEHEQYLVYSLNLRALLEHSASQLFLSKKFSKTFEQLIGQGNKTKISSKLEKLNTFNSKLYYGTRFFKDEGLENAINVMTMLQELDNDFSHAMRAYEFLSDFCHPNFGSNILFSKGCLESHGGPTEVQLNRLAHKLLSITLYILHLKRSTSYYFGTIGLNIENVIFRATHDRTNLANLFVTDSQNFTGDGKTKDTAIYFYKARSKHDHIKMQYEYLSNQGIKSERKYLSDSDEVFLYDKHETQKGYIWFKSPQLQQSFEESNWEDKI